jgi:DNA-binding winged helix-turn-helix (wHTH) protein
VSRTSSESGIPEKLLRFGAFELDLEAQQLLKNGRTVRLQPQPFKLLCFLISLRGQLVTRDQIRGALWSGDTFVDVEQGVNFAIKQVRDALGEEAEHPLYIQTVPRRGYRFVAPVEVISGAEESPVYPPGTDLNLQKVLWTNIADLRLAEARRVQRRQVVKKAVAVLGIVAVVAALYLLRTLWN